MSICSFCVAIELLWFSHCRYRGFIMLCVAVLIHCVCVAANQKNLSFISWAHTLAHASVITQSRNPIKFELYKNTRKSGRRTAVMFFMCRAESFFGSESRTELKTTTMPFDSQAFVCERNSMINPLYLRGRAVYTKICCAQETTCAVKDTQRALS